MIGKSRIAVRALLAGVFVLFLAEIVPFGLAIPVVGENAG